MRKEQVSLSLPQSIGEEVRLLDALKGLEDSFELELELTPAAKTTRVGSSSATSLAMSYPSTLT